MSTNITAYVVEQPSVESETEQLEYEETDMVRIKESAFEAAGLDDVGLDESTDGEYEYERLGFIIDSHTEDFNWVSESGEGSITVGVPEGETVYVVGMATEDIGSHPFVGSDLESVDRDSVIGDVDADISDVKEDEGEEESAQDFYPESYAQSLLSAELESSMDELDEVYSEWSNKVTMSASQLRQWSKNPCSREASVDPLAVIRRNLRLLETNKSDWDTGDISDAKRTISFIDRMSAGENKPESPMDGSKGCPTKWAISLLNWAYNPFDSIPGIPDEMDAVEEAAAYSELEEDDPIDIADVPTISRGDTGRPPWPESWRESKKPARLIAMDAWIDMGASFRGCRRSMMGSVRNPNRLCASFKDAIYGHTYWRN